MLGNRRIRVPDADENAACASCGYNLLGIADSGTCPECGSLAGIARLGTLLPLADERSLARLRSGTWLVCWAASVVVMLPFVSIALVAVLAGLSAASLSPDAEEILETVVSVFSGAFVIALVLVWSLGWTRFAAACEDDRIAATGAVVRRGCVVASAVFAAGVVTLGVIAMAESLEWISLFSRLSEPVVIVWFSVIGLSWCVSAVLGILMVRAVLVRTAAKAARRRAAGLLWTSPVLLLNGVSVVGMYSAPVGGMLGSGAGCGSLASWLWLVFLASLMLLMGGEIRLARRVRGARGALVASWEAGRGAAARPAPADVS